MDLRLVERRFVHCHYIERGQAVDGVGDGLRHSSACSSIYSHKRINGNGPRYSSVMSNIITFMNSSQRACAQLEFLGMIVKILACISSYCSMEMSL